MTDRKEAHTDLLSQLKTFDKKSLTKTGAYCPQPLSFARLSFCFTRSVQGLFVPRPIPTYACSSESVRST